MPFVEKATSIIEIVKPEVKINKERIRRKARIKDKKSELVKYARSKEFLYVF
jgi:hypothetical protein